jgi:hypothetical protein
MKRAKFILTSTAILAIIGGTLAFNASKFQPANIWYIPQGGLGTTQTTIFTDGFLYMTTILNCTKACLRTTNVGPLVNTSTVTTSPFSTTVFTRINPLGGPPLTFATTFPYCTRIQTRTTLCDE